MADGRVDTNRLLALRTQQHRSAPQGREHERGEAGAPARARRVHARQPGVRESASVMKRIIIIEDTQFRRTFIAASYRARATR